MAMRIIKAEHKQLSLLVALHVAAFPTNFLTQLGPRFLRLYYRLILDDPNGILLVAKDDSRDDLVGFVAGMVNPPAFYARMKRKSISLALAVVLPVILSPRRFGRLLHNRRRVKSVAASREDQEGVVELSSLAVQPDQQGRGVGKALTAAFIARARDQGARVVVLTTDAEGNDYVNRFYQKMGFACEAFADSPPGRPMNRYSKTLSAVTIPT
jgi:ribosomal protein S18 acetylase RimI-like enzyme